jgi:glucokinase
MYRIGIDIGGTKIHVGLFHEKEARLLADKKEYVRNIRNLSEFVKETVATLCDGSGIALSDVTFCGVGIPGTVSEDGKRILKAPNISILSEDLAAELASVLNVPVQLVQDSRAAAWGEYLVCGQKPRTLVCITLGTGIGTGIVIDGKIYHGALGSAGELGHLPTHKEGRACGCGKIGCLEKYCAGGGLDLTAAELLGAGKGAAELFEEAKNGNESAKQAIADAVQMLGSALVSVVNLLSPDCILFSGGLSKQTELYVDPLIAYVREHCYSAGLLPTVKTAALGENSPLYGAALMPVNQAI